MKLEEWPYERRVKKSILIDHAMKLHKGPTNCVIQAGGHVGVWPNRLTEYFDEIHTFEPHAHNYPELLRNINGDENIYAYPWALGDTYCIRQLKSSTKSSGMHHIDKEGDDVLMVSIDWFCSKHSAKPNALFLDIEGYELYALKGAIEIIKEMKPLIVCEENATCERYGFKEGDLAKWLSDYGYKLGRKYKKDLIFWQS